MPGTGPWLRERARRGSVRGTLRRSCVTAVGRESDEPRVDDATDPDGGTALDRRPGSSPGDCPIDRAEAPVGHFGISYMENVFGEMVHSVADRFVGGGGIVIVMGDLRLW